MFSQPPISTLFPYTSLFRSHLVLLDEAVAAVDLDRVGRHPHRGLGGEELRRRDRDAGDDRRGDRKSTRLNSSHTVISYAVFCLKKKKDRIKKESETRYLHKY